MKRFSYFGELMKSTGEFFKNPVLMLPFVYIFVVSTIFLLITPQPTPENLGLTVVLTILGFAVLQGLISIIFEGAALTTYRDYLEKKQIDAGTQIQGGFKLYGKVLVLKILQVLIIVIPAIILLLLFALITSLMHVNIFDASVSKATTLLVIFVLIYAVYLLLASMALMFSSVAISYKGTGPWTAIKESYKIFQQDTMHSFLTFVLLVLYILVYILIVTAITTVISWLVLGAQETSIAAEVITSLLTLPLGGIILLYIFKAFKPEEKLAEIKVETTNKTIKKAAKKTSKKRK